MTNSSSLFFLRRRVLPLVVLMLFFISCYGSSAGAFSGAQRELFQSNILYFDADACSISASSLTPASSAPDGATFPDLDPTAMANSVDRFIQKENSHSALKGLGATIVASSKNSNISPFLVAAIAREETSMADPSSYNVLHANNPFSREATSSQPNYPGTGPNVGTLWYKWSSVKASVDYTAPENQNVQGGGDFPAYLRAQYPSELSSDNLLDLFMKYAPPGQNNTTQYTALVKGWISDMVSGAGQPVGGATPAPNGQSGTTCACSNSNTTLTGSDNKEKIFNYFVGKGLTAAQAAGIDGNFGQESGWNPSDAGGYLAQWGGSRLNALAAFAQKQGISITDLGVQLDYVWLELTNGDGAGEDDSATLQHLKATTTAADAATIFSNEYERPSDPQLQNRIDYANQILAAYGGVSNGGSGSLSCSSTVNCSNPASPMPGLSQTRQNVVCIAQQELSLWKSQPGYPTPSFSQSGYLKYSQGRTEEWCADFASWVYNQASDPLQAGSNWNIAYVPNIQSVGEQNGSFHWHPQSSNYTPKPGDLAIHGANHVNIYISSSGSTATYIGGDQGSGPYPGGSIVSIETGNGYYDNGITGYVSPD